MPGDDAEEMAVFLIKEETSGGRQRKHERGGCQHTFPPAQAGDSQQGQKPACQQQGCVQADGYTIDPVYFHSREQDPRYLYIANLRGVSL